MRPPALQFDFSPRRRLRWLPPALALAALLVLSTGGLLLKREAGLRRFQDELLAAEQGSARKAAPARGRASEPWEANAVRDGALLQLPVEARLLELERCVVNGMSLASVRFDAASQGVSAEVRAVTQTQATELTQCLNQGVGRSWVVDSIEFGDNFAKEPNFTLRIHW
ncbi:hypothetical protein LRH25_32525 [Ideonella azotifigens]|uniref:hypothetical protein n=1 Tax=Ideonella azotifigens TaxID=513160 RepID=UPI001144459D|nr:hypothetical protein [Ideonella azotifigens]MCD2345042.1 hypothetical protein [Ideonella azotifigens]